MAFTQGLFAKLVADTAPAELRGTAFGVFNLVSGGALLLASVIAGALWSAWGAGRHLRRRRCSLPSSPPSGSSFTVRRRQPRAQAAIEILLSGSSGAECEQESGRRRG